MTQKWTGAFFEDITLGSLGFKMVLGHDVNSGRVRNSMEHFTIVDTTGIHTFPVSFCGCPTAPHPRLQLLRAGLMLASLSRPQSAFTFDVLDTFHLLTLQSKISAFDFYYSLEHKTDNTGINKPKVMVY